MKNVTTIVAEVSEIRLDFNVAKRAGDLKPMSRVRESVDGK